MSTVPHGKLSTSVATWSWLAQLQAVAFFYSRGGAGFCFCRMQTSGVFSPILPNF